MNSDDCGAVELAIAGCYLCGGESRMKRLAFDLAAKQSLGCRAWQKPTGLIKEQQWAAAGRSGDDVAVAQVVDLSLEVSPRAFGGIDFAVGEDLRFCHAVQLHHLAGKSAE